MDGGEAAVAVLEAFDGRAERDLAALRSIRRAIPPTSARDPQRVAELLDQAPRRLAATGQRRPQR